MITLLLYVMQITLNYVMTFENLLSDIDLCSRQTKGVLHVEWCCEQKDSRGVISYNSFAIIANLL